MSNEQLGFVFRLTAKRISFDNASIFPFRQPERLSKRYQNIFVSPDKAKRNNCSLLTSNCSLKKTLRIDRFFYYNSKIYELRKFTQ